MARTDRPERELRQSTDKPRRTPITSYYAGGGSSAVPDRGQKPALSKKLRLLPTFIAILVIAGSIFYSMTLSAYPSVEIVGDTPVIYRDQEEYASEVAQLMNRTLANRTKLTAKTDEVEQELLRKFPELKAAALRLPVLGRKPTLVIDINRPGLLLATQSQSFVLDQDGFAVSEVKHLAQEYRTGIPLVQDKSGMDIGLGQQVLPSTTVQFVQDVQAQLTAAGLTATGYILPVSVNELDIYIDGISYFVKTDTAGDARLQIGSFLSTKAYLERQGDIPAEYIDVRVEEKVFYK